MQVRLIGALHKENGEGSEGEKLGANAARRILHIPRAAFESLSLMGSSPLFPYSPRSLSLFIATRTHNGPSGFKTLA